MWSVKYTGYQGVVKDSYQRICLRMPATEFLEPVMFNKVRDLVSAYMLRHILLEVDLKDSTLDYNHLYDNCTILKDLTLPEEKVIFTCEVANYERDNTAIKSVMECIQPTVVMLKRCATRNKTLTMMKYLAQDTADIAELQVQTVKNSEHEGEGNEGHDETGGEQEDGGENVTSSAPLTTPQPSKSKAPAIPVALGASGLIDEEKQYVLDAQRGTIRAMCLGPVTYPNLFTVSIDLLHSRECNAYVTLDSFDDDHTRGLGKFVKKYKKPAPAIIAKALLELGAVVCVDRTLIDNEFFYSDIMRLAHPFTHMQVCQNSMLLLCCDEWNRVGLYVHLYLNFVNVF
jgi:hypothetical protein